MWGRTCVGGASPVGRCVKMVHQDAPYIYCCAGDKPRRYALVFGGASRSFTSFEDKFGWRKMPKGVILSAAKNLPAG